jgi:hypothetical protein
MTAFYKFSVDKDHGVRPSTILFLASHKNNSCNLTLSGIVTHARLVAVTLNFFQLSTPDC